MKIKNSDLDTSLLCLGTDHFGERIDETECIRLLDYYLANGGNHIDCAAIYGGKYHVSEAVLGRYFEKTKCRSKIILATKGGHPPLDNMHSSRLDIKNLTEDIDASLLALKTDYADIFYLHRDYEKTAVGEIMDNLHELISAGKTRYIGVSNWKIDRINAANEYAKKNGLEPIIVSELLYSLAFMNAAEKDDTLLEMTEEEHKKYEGNDITVTSYSPQARGYFAKKQRSEQTGESYMPPFENESNIKKYEFAKQLSVKYNKNVNQIALSYLLSQTFTVLPILGCSKLYQLEDSMKCLDIKLTREELNQLKDL